MLYLRWAARSCEEIAFPDSTDLVVFVQRRHTLSEPLDSAFYHTLTRLVQICITIFVVLKDSVHPITHPQFNRLMKATDH